MTQISVAKFLFNDPWAPLEEVLGVAGAEYGKQHNVQDEKELLMLATNGTPLMVIAAISKASDITVVVTFLKANRKLVKEGHIKFAAVNFVNNRQLESALLKSGCQEVLDPSIRGKALKYKMDFWKKTLAGSGQNKGSDSNTTIKSKSVDAKADGAVDNAPKWVEPMNCVDDMYLVKNNPQDVKKVMGKWLIRFTGPSPFVGQWIENPNKRGVWHFGFKDAVRKDFQSTDGFWFFMGDQKPEFIWKENLWMISGRQFQLLHKNKDVQVVRFQSIGGNLEICRNSNYAMAREALIRESFDQEIMVKKGVITPTEAKTLENDNSALSGHLTGKSEGEEAINGDPLSGKSSTDHMEGGPLSGKSSTDNLGSHDPLSGKGSPADQQGGPLEGKGSTEKRDAPPLQGPNGKEGDIGADPLSGGWKPEKKLKDLSGNAGTDDVGPTEYKGHNEHTVNEREAELAGKTETDDLGLQYYQGRMIDPKNPPKKADKESAGWDGKVDKPLKGKSATDDLGSNHYGGESDGQHANKKGRDEAVATGEAASAERKGKEGYVEAPQGGPLKGKGGTDDLGANHYGGDEIATSAKKKEQNEDTSGLSAAEKKARADVEKLNEEGHSSAEEISQEAPEAGQELIRKRAEKLAGKTQTEDLGKGHWGGKRGDADIEEKMGQLDDLLPEGNGEDPRGNLNPEAAKHYAKGDAPVIPLFREKSETPDFDLPQDGSPVPFNERVADAAMGENATMSALIRKKGDSKMGVVAQMDDFFDQVIMVRAAEGHFAVGDEIEFSMVFEYLKKTKKVEFSGHCEQIDADDGGVVLLTVALSAEHARLFSGFMQLYQLRQQHVEHFLNKAKGL